MTIAQVLLLSVALLAISLVIVRYRENKLSPLSFVTWLILWIAGAIAIVFPDSTIVVAHLLGIGRGADLVLYLCAMLILSLLFRVYVRLEQMERDLTEIVRMFALQEAGLVRRK